METTSRPHLAAPRTGSARGHSTRVLSVPAAHPYVRSLGAPVRLLPDPRPPGAEPGRWWPPPALDPEWLRGNLDRFDLLHVHFGTESLPAGQLDAALDVLAAAGKPVVHTVHDLEHPQLTDPAGHDAALATLVTRAAALITLTDAAADVLRRRFGRRPVVVGHPAMLPLDLPRPAGRPTPVPIVSVHLRDLRPNVDGPGTVRTLLAAADRLRGAGIDVALRVYLHDRVRDPDAADAVRALCAVGGVELTQRPRPGDVALDRQLADAHISVLPYAHGTHSGWLEHCWDLGVAVAIPDVGCIHDQHDDPATLAAFTRGDAGSLAAALERLLRTAPRAGSQQRHRLQARRLRARQLDAPRIAAAHADVYAAASAS